MAQKLEQKVAIITGGARGLGESVARMFVAEGARVIIADVSDAVGQKLCEELGPNAHYVHLDVTSESDWQRAIDSTCSRFGNPTVLVNNAGIYRPAPMESVSADEYMLTIRINQLGTFLGMRSVIKPMKEAGAGSIVNIASTAALQGQAGALSYVASKFAVRGMTKTAALELAPFRIRVNSVHPGAMATPMLVEAFGAPDTADLIKRDMPSIPVRRMSAPVEIARLVLYVASDDASYSTGGEFIADGGLTAGLFSQDET